MLNPTVYILSSAKLHRCYIGFTNDLDERMKFYQNSESNKFTYNADDWEIFYTIKCSSKVQGLKIETHIKKMKSKIYIENLKKYPEITLKLLEKYKDC